MNTKKLRLFKLFILLCGLICIVSIPAKAQTARFRVVLNGYKVVHQTLEGAIDNMGWGDEVTLVNQIGTVDSSGILRRTIRGNTFTTIMGSTQVANTLRAGTASSTGGLQTGDDFPTANPAMRTMPIRSGNPPVTLFDGELTRNANAAVIIPTIWEWDGSTPSMQNDYADAMDAFASPLGTAVSRLISATASSSIDAFLRSGSTVGIGNTITFDYGLPMTRPIGVQAVGNRFGFTPQVLILTYDQADLISRTDFSTGAGVGVFPITYTDASLFQGEYKLFLQVERVNPECPASRSPLSTNFRGTATLTIDNKQTPKPFVQDINLTIDFADCRAAVRITNFPAISVMNSPLGQPNTTTITMTSGGTGIFNPDAGRIDIPITLHFRHSIKTDMPALASLAQPSDLVLTLSTNGNGGQRLSNGNVVMFASGRFTGGFLEGSGATLSVNGTFTPSP